MPSVRYRTKAELYFHCTGPLRAGPILFRASMAPALFVEFGLKALRHSRVVVAWVAARAGRSGAAAGAGVLAFPGSIRVGFTNPATVLAQRAFHGLPSLPGLLPRISLTFDSAMPRVRIQAVWSGPTCVVRQSSRVGPLPGVTMRREGAGPRRRVCL